MSTAATAFARRVAHACSCPARRVEVLVAASLSRAVVFLVGVCLMVLANHARVSAQTPLDADAYVALVLASHPTASEQRGLTAAAAAERGAVRLWPDPVVSFSGGHGRSSDGALKGAETEVAVSQTIPWPSAFTAGKRVGETTATAFEANADILRWELVATARQAFARLVTARARVGIARETETDARSLRDLVERRAELGETRESDRIKATVEWLRQQRALATAEREASAAEAIVRTLAVQPLPRPLTLVSSPEAVAAPTLRTDLSPGDLAARNPRVLAARAEAERQQALLGLAKASRGPNFDVNVFRNDEIDKASTGVSVGLRVPLWNANRGDIARATAATTVSSAEAERVRLEIATELETSLRDLQVAADQVSLLQGEIFSAAQRSVDLARFSYEEGETSLLDLLDAQRTFRDTQRELAEARLAFSLALADAQRLAGPDFTPWK